MLQIKLTSTEPLWVVYVLIYCATLAYLLNRRRFETKERILWFLVITFAPVIGIVLFFLVGKDDKIPAKDTPKNRTPLSDTAGTPWQNDPGYTKDSPS
jgi:ABC-type molybdate transport system permease subunit